MATTADSTTCAVYRPAKRPHTQRAMMVLLAKATDRELARFVSYLKEENRILRACLSAWRLDREDPVKKPRPTPLPAAGRVDQSGYFNRPRVPSQ